MVQTSPALYSAAVPSSRPSASGPLVLPAALSWAVLCALTVTGKSARDALFCAQFSTAALPRAMAAGALLSALFALAAGRATRRSGPARVLPPLLCANALAFAVEHALSGGAPRALSLVVYLHVSASNGLLLSSFWSVVNERFDPHALRHNVSRIGLGGTLGGFLGGLSAERIAAWFGARHALLALALFSVLAAVAVRALGAPPAPRDAREDGATPARPFASVYLRRIAVFVALTTLASSLVDFAFKARAMDRFDSSEALIQFFALFYSATSLVSFLVQALLTSQLLERRGLGAGLGAHPAALAASGLVALVAPGLPAQVLARGADGALVASLARSAYEPLYTPLPPAAKRVAKGVIDVLVNRLGDGLGSLIAWALVLLAPSAAASWANAAVVAAALAAIFVAFELREGYVAELAESLRSGALVLDEAGVQDQTTRLTLSRTLTDLNRERLLAEIQRQRELELAAAPPAAPPAPEAPAHAAQLVADLLADDPERAHRALAAAGPAHTAFIIPLLAREDLGAEAMNVLDAFGTRVIGQLADALLDPSHVSPTVRRRLVRVIARARTPWAAIALAAALGDPDFDVRRQVVRGLEELADAGVDVPLERTSALGAAERELDGCASPTGDDRVEHVLRLLGLVLDREAFRLARAALAHPDATLQGTALEYLDNVLPAPIKSRLIQALAPSPGRRTSQRVERELLDELRRTLG